MFYSIYIISISLVYLLNLETDRNQDSMEWKFKKKKPLLLMYIRDLTHKNNKEAVYWYLFHHTFLKYIWCSANHYSKIQQQKTTRLVNAYLQRHSGESPTLKLYNITGMQRRNAIAQRHIAIMKALVLFRSFCKREDVGRHIAMYLSMLII